MAGRKKTVKKSKTKRNVENNKDLSLKILISIIVIFIIVSVIFIVYSGKRIVCTRTITNDKATIKTTYILRFKSGKLDTIDGNVKLDFIKDDETSQDDFDKLVDRVNNSDKYENVHINKYNKKADIDYNVKIDKAELGDDLSFDAVYNVIKDDEDLGNCVVK